MDKFSKNFGKSKHKKPRIRKMQGKFLFAGGYSPFANSAMAAVRPSARGEIPSR